jgi:hypothetical protein
MQFPVEEIADLGFFSDLPIEATPSAIFSCDRQIKSPIFNPN